MSATATHGMLLKPPSQNQGCYAMAMFVCLSVARSVYLSSIGLTGPTAGGRERLQHCWTSQASAGRADGGGDLSRRPFGQH